MTEATATREPKTESPEVVEARILSRIKAAPVLITDAVKGEHTAGNPEWDAYKRLARAGKIARWNNNGKMKIMDANEARRVRPQAI